MAEVVVVSAIILVALTGLYISYSKLFTIYNQRINYYDIKTLYKLANYRDTIINASSIPNADTNLSTVQGETIYYLNKDDIINKNQVAKVVNQTFKDYIEYLSGSLDAETPNILIMERCDADGASNCKYAYLEVYG